MKRAALLLALALLAATPPARAQELGRLFFTPEQRAALDARRRARVPDKPAAVPQAEQPTTRVDGAVRRSGGRSTVWVNGEAIPENPRAEGARLETEGAKSGRVSVPAGESARRYDLRVGETLDRNTGEVHDVIPGEVRVRPRGAAARSGAK
ncbi:MAG TPA: hypothetical protein VHN19_03150 [Burkholderiales bacterium]|jgi:uncharacterized protein YfaP (DUF2135 family)|nr:hypothetical protein [Burkholderiales bacterium]